MAGLEIKIIAVIVPQELQGLVLNFVISHYLKKGITIKVWNSLIDLLNSKPEAASNYLNDFDTVLSDDLGIIMVNDPADMEKLIELKAFIVVIDTRNHNILKSGNFANYEIPEDYAATRTSFLNLGYSLNSITQRITSVLHALRMGICVKSE